MPFDREIVHRFHQVLLEEIRRTAPEYLAGEFTVAEIYQKLVPYRTHRDRIGIEMNGDYEDALLRLLAGEGELLALQSEPARKRIRTELESSNPNTGIYREFAAVGVRLSLRDLPADRAGMGADPAEGSSGASEAPPSAPGLFEPASPRTEGTNGAEGPEAGAGAVPAECPACSRGLPSRSALRYCPHCGVDVRERPCSGCGEVLEWEWAYCIACGAPAAPG